MIGLSVGVQVSISNPNMELTDMCGAGILHNGEFSLKLSITFVEV